MRDGEWPQFFLAGRGPATRDITKRRPRIMCGDAAAEQGAWKNFGAHDCRLRRGLARRLVVLRVVIQHVCNATTAAATAPLPLPLPRYCTGLTACAAERDALCTCLVVSVCRRYVPSLSFGLSCTRDDFALQLADEFPLAARWFCAESADPSALGQRLSAHKRSSGSSSPYFFSS